jgi:hypothetical protein
MFDLIHLESHPGLSFVLKKHSVDASAFHRHSQCFGGNATVAARFPSPIASPFFAEIGTHLTV